MKRVLAFALLAIMLLSVFTACKKVTIKCYEGSYAETFAKENNFIISNDTGLVDEVVKNAILADPKAVADFKGGKEKALMALFGKCMKELKGNCNPQTLKEILIDAINKMD